ncbi:MAG: hypothetical protein WC700_16275 [Gemmatimonadaceae bacterium]|jgi:hypothetical protein
MKQSELTRREIVLREARRYLAVNAGNREGIGDAVAWAADGTAERMEATAALVAAWLFVAPDNPDDVGRVVLQLAACDQAIAAAGLAAILEREDAPAKEGCVFDAGRTCCATHWIDCEILRVPA